MKQLACLTICLCGSLALALTAFGGPEPLPSGKEMKEVAPAPTPCCNWQGFYIGINVGGQFGHSEDKLLNEEFDDESENIEQPWGYSESGVVAGGQVGYNFQWNWLVLGAEADAGYMNLDGNGEAPANFLTDSGIFGESDSDFYTTFRGRIGVALNCWLFYATGGGIGLNYDTRVVYRPDPSDLDAHTQDFDWGYTFGGGIERRIGCHWSVKVEYLYYQLDTQDFHYTVNGPNGGIVAPAQSENLTYHLNGETEGHIVRAGLNYKF